MKIVDSAIKDERLDISLLLFQEQTSGHYVNFCVRILSEAAGCQRQVLRTNCPLRQGLLLEFILLP